MRLTFVHESGGDILSQHLLEWPPLSGQTVERNDAVASLLQVLIQLSRELHVSSDVVATFAPSSSIRSRQKLSHISLTPMGLGVNVRNSPRKFKSESSPCDADHGPHNQSPKITSHHKLGTTDDEIIDLDDSDKKETVSKDVLLIECKKDNIIAGFFVTITQEKDIFSRKEKERQKLVQTLTSQLQQLLSKIYSLVTHPWIPSISKTKEKRNAQEEQEIKEWINKNWIMNESLQLEMKNFVEIVKAQLAHFNKPENER